MRLGSAVMLTAATAYLAYALIRRLVRPQFVWLYLGAVLTGLAIARWTFFFVAIGVVPDPPASAFAEWQASINQTLYILLGVAMVVLIRSHILGMRRLGRWMGHE